MKVLIARGSAETADSLLSMMKEIPAVELLSPTQDAQATLESVRTNDPDVLVVNAHMPGAEEADLLQTLREEKPLATLIVLTRLSYREFRNRLSVWEDFLSMQESTAPVPFTDCEPTDMQAHGVWVKFSCGELGLLHLPDETIFDVVARTL